MSGRDGSERFVGPEAESQIDFVAKVLHTVRVSVREPSGDAPKIAGIQVKSPGSSSNLRTYQWRPSADEIQFTGSEVELVAFSEAFELDGGRVGERPARFRSDPVTVGEEDTEVTLELVEDLGLIVRVDWRLRSSSNAAATGCR